MSPEIAYSLTDLQNIEFALSKIGWVGSGCIRCIWCTQITVEAVYRNSMEATSDHNDQILK